MSCVNCGKNDPDVRMPCEVCRLVNNDESVKRVKYCDTCSAYICAEHWNDAFARLEAAAKTVANKVKKAITGKNKKDETTKVHS